MERKEKFVFTVFIRKSRLTSCLRAMRDNFDSSSKLSLKSDFHVWQLKLKFHVMMYNAWGFISTGEALTEQTIQGDVWTPEQLQARSMRDILSSLDNDILMLVSGCETAREVYDKVKSLFVGSDAAYRAQLSSQLFKWQFRGNWFAYLNGFNARVLRLDNIEGINSYKDIALLLLNNLPRDKYAMLIYSVKQQIDTAQDTFDTYDLALKALTNFAIEAGLYTSQSQAAPSSAKCSRCNVKHRGRNCPKCFKCNQVGHLANNCPVKVEAQAAQVCSNGDEATEHSTPFLCALVRKTTPGDINSFLVDSGASHHVVGDASILHDVKKIAPLSVITVAGEVSVDTMGTVKGTIASSGKHIILQQVLLVPDSPNLLSVQRLTANGFKVLFDSQICRINKEDETLLQTTTGRVKIQVHQPSQATALSVSENVLWHFRCNHISPSRLKHLNKDQSKSKFTNSQCKGCCQGKMQRARIQSKKKQYQCFNKLVGDAMGPFEKSVDNKKGIFLLTDVGSNFIWGHCYKSRTEIAPFIKHIVSHLERFQPGKLQYVKTDNALEFKSKDIQQYFRDKGIVQQYSSAYLHEENGRAESTNKQILFAARALLQSASMSSNYWSYAMKCAIFQQNCIPKVGNEHSPYYLLYNQEPPINRLKVFGSCGYAHIHRENRPSLSPTSVQVRFLGYSADSNQYIVQSMKYKQQIFKVRTVRLDEEKIVQDNKFQSFVDPPNNVQISKKPDDKSQSNPPNEIIQDTDTECVIKDTNDSTRKENDNSTNVLIKEKDKSGAETPRYNLRPRKQIVYAALCQIRNMFESKTAYGLLVQTSTPNTKGYGSFKEALLSDDREQWRNAYRDELKKLEKIGGLSVVEKPKNEELLPFLEVLTEKIDPVLKTRKYKVRLAARGDLQKFEGASYSPVPYIAEQRTFLALCIGLDLYMLQADISSAFLHGRLSSPVYFHLPMGHPLYGKKNLCYKSNAAVYGLKNSGRIWYLHFTSFLKQYGFIESRICPGLLYLPAENRFPVVYLCLYVDDFLFSSKST